MSTHETASRTAVVEPGSDRSFGLVVGTVLLTIGGYQYFFGSIAFVWLAIFGAILVLLGLTAPRVLRPLNIAWTKLGILLGKVVTPVVMLLVYLITIVPIGLVLRVSGKNLLGLRREGSETYWIPRTPPGPPPESLKDQF